MIRPLYYKTRRGESPSRAFQGCRSYFISLWEKGGGTGAALYLMAPAFSTSTMSKSFFSDFFSICFAKKSAASTEPSA